MKTTTSIKAAAIATVILNSLFCSFSCLHAAVIGFVHPRTGAYLEFSAPLPEWFEAFLRKLTPED